MGIPKVKLNKVIKKLRGRLKVKRNQRRLLYLSGTMAICLLATGLVVSQVQAQNQKQDLEHSLYVRQQSLQKLRNDLQTVQKQKTSTEQEVQQKAAEEANLKAQLEDLNKQLQAKAVKQSLLAKAASAATFTATASAETIPTPAPSAPQGDIQSIITAAANAHGVSPAWMLRVASCESGFNLYAHNPSGATGLFQYKPATWASFSAQAGYGGASIYDAEAQANTTAWAFASGLQSNWECS